MLVATPGQTTAYSIIHNNSNAGGGGNSTAAATSSSKKSTTLNSTNTTAASGTPKSLNNNNHTTSTVANKNSLNNNTHGTVSYNYHTNPKNDNSTSNKLNNQTKMTATSSRDSILSSVNTAAATTHSSKTENSTNNANANNNTTTTKQQSFIQTLKDSVQKALISTTGSSNTTLAQKFSADNKLTNNCNNFTTSIQNVTSSSSSTSHNANKVSTTTSSTNSSNSTIATQSSSSSSLVRSKYFSCSLSKLHTVAPTILHRYPEERQHASSTDSLQKEMCHFKPIRIVPTTPWKSGSKSRGNSLRFPKANLATKKTEFVLKSNCDLNNRKKKQQQNRTQTDKINVDEDNDDDDDDNNEQENKEFYGIYKPKPSLTCLSTSVTTPNHQSAFVCLVAQMKSLVNLQSKKQHRPVKSAAAADESITELYVRKKPATKKSSQLEVPKELAKTRTTRLSSNAVKNKRVSNTNTIALNHSKENVKRKNAKSNNLSKLSTVAITKAKSHRKVGRAKSKTINLINLATTRAKGKLQTSVSMPAVISNESKTVAAATSKRTRKRKNPHDNDETDPPNKTASIKSLVPTVRKSSRQSKDMSSATNKLFKSPINQNLPQTTLKSTQKSTRKNLAKAVCFSPPLTRSRLKHLTEQGKIITANTPVVAKKRRN